MNISKQQVAKALKDHQRHTGRWAVSATEDASPWLGLPLATVCWGKVPGVCVKRLRWGLLGGLHGG